MRMIITLFSIILFFSSCSSIKEVKKNEKYYQTKFCEELNGVMEYTLEDKTRVDCLTDDYAIEVDWAKKWAEAVGQSLYYSLMTNKKAGVALIVSPSDKIFLERINKLAKEFKIKIFIIDK